MPTNYADALKRKPPPPPQNRQHVEEKSQGTKRPRQNEQRRSTPSKNTAAASSQQQRATAWGKPSTVASVKKPPSILKRPKEEPPSAAPAVAKPPPTKKSKNNSMKKRPSQKMSLGDVIPKHVVSSKASSKTVPSDDPPPTIKQEPMQVSSQEEFPSLSAGARAATTTKPKFPAHAGWAKKAPPIKKEKLKPPPKPKKPKPPVVKQKERSSLLDFGAKPRAQDDRQGELDLIRLMQNGKAQGTTKKGRQRIAPRKKKFSTLKKKVLAERLEAWRKLHPEESPTKSTTAPKSTGLTVPPATEVTTCTVCLRNFAESDEVEDDDEYEEIVENIKDMASKVGPIRDAFLDRQSSGSCPAFVLFETPTNAVAACACWNGLVVGGQSLEPVLLHPKLGEGATQSDSARNEAWRNAVLIAYTTKQGSAENVAASTLPSRIILRNALSEDDFEDKEHLEQSLSHIRSLVDKHGTVSDFQTKQEDGEVTVVVTYNGGISVAQEAAAKLNGLLLGGSALSASLAGDEKLASGTEYVVELKNALTEDDLEDEDCLKESLSDIESLARQHGPLSTSSDAVKAAGTSVLITYHGDVSIAETAAAKLDGTLLGGNILQASVMLSSGDSRSPSDSSGWVLLQNMLTDEDLEDEECMNESIGDVRELASQYGKVLNVSFDPNDLTRVVRIEFEGASEVAMFAAQKFNNMVLGGQTIAAIALGSGKETKAPVTVATSVEPKEAITTDTAPKPMYSGDKLIPERFAECKRVPKVVTSTGPRDYASLSNNEEMVPLLIEMLGELMRLQRRAIEDKNAKARRRIVMGLREVARGIRAHKVKMVVMANNVDQYGAIDEKLQEILDLARQEDVPVIFELNKRKLGKAVGKSIKVSVVGIQSAEGAYQQFKKLSALAAKRV